MSTLFLLFPNFLLLSEHEEHEEHEYYHQGCRDSREELLTSHINSHKGIAVCLNAREDRRADERRAKAADSAKRRLDRGGLNEILGLDEVEGYVEEILVYRRERAIVEHRIDVYEPARRRGREDVENEAGCRDSRTEQNSCRV